MGLYEFLHGQERPQFPVRKKEDVLAIVRRWENGPYEEEWPDEDAEVDWDQLEQDIHALAAVAMEALPD